MLEFICAAWQNLRGRGCRELHDIPGRRTRTLGVGTGNDGNGAELVGGRASRNDPLGSNPVGFLQLAE
jgi:hypothetical protein